MIQLRLAYITLATCGLIAAALLCAKALADGRPAKVPHGEIIWDKHGIPHVYGKTVEDVLYGYGYVQMKSHAEIILKKVAAGRGRLAEYFGPGKDGANLVTDTQVRTFGIPGRAKAWLADGTEEQRQYLAIFCAGAQAYLDKHSSTVDQAFLQVAPVTPADILAVTQLTIHFGMMLEESNVAPLIEQWKRGTGAPAAAAQIQQGQGQELRRRFDRIRRKRDLNGSNGWALAPSKSANHAAILMGNPHLTWGVNSPISDEGMFQWFEAHLVVGSGNGAELNASGVTFAGAPYIGVGYSDDVGWTHTNNPMKNADLYDVVLDGKGGYTFDGETRPLAIRLETLLIRQADGSLAPQTIPILATVHGPIVAQREDGHALALRVAGLDGNSIVSQYWGMIRARNLKEFNKANQALQMPFFNVVYADRHGEIMYLFGGKQPVRDGGAYADHAGVLDGATSKTLWTKTLPWDELPKTINPSGGFVQNSNDGPWTSTFPQSISPAAHPAWIAPLGMELRPQQGASFLLSKPKFTADEVNLGKQSTKLLLAERILPDLLQAAQGSSDAIVKQAVRVLASWDRTADAASKGAALFERWYELYVSAEGTPQSSVFGPGYPAFRVEWSANQPLTTPFGLAKPADALPYLAAAAKELENQFGTMAVNWGTVHRDMLVSHDARFLQTTLIADRPSSGAWSVYGPLRISANVPFGSSPIRVNAGGDGYIQVVEFDRKAGAKAMTLLAYGNSSRPGSKHIADQLSIFEAKKLRPSLRRRCEVLANAVETERY